MPPGGGKYAEQLNLALAAAGAKRGVLVVLDGTEGPGFSAALYEEETKEVPKLLRQVADAIDKDIKEGKSL